MGGNGQQEDGRSSPCERVSAPGAAADALPPARILVVDDTPSNLRAVEAVLAPLGQHVVCAASGEQALWHVLRGEFAVIVMDVQMPGMSGLETARLLKSRESTRCIPLLFITGHEREAGLVAQGYHEGAVDWLLKPVDADILRSKVAVFVELHQRGELLKRQALELAARERSQEEMRRAAELEQRLLGIVGHDIRSPLAAILTTAQLQLRSDDLPAPQVRAFERIVRGGERIRQVVDLLLDFTRACIGGGIPVAPRPCDLRGLCTHLVDEARARAPDRELHCELPQDALEGEWDPARLTQALANLVDNALKYGAAGTPVRLVARGDADGVCIEVHNHGPPIPEERRAELLQPFRRGSTTDAAAPDSLGLGLFIVSEIARAHAGRLEVESGAEAGTTFRLCLPRSPAGRDASQPEAAPAA